MYNRRGEPNRENTERLKEIAACQVVRTVGRNKGGPDNAKPAITADEFESGAREGKVPRKDERHKPMSHDEL